MTRYAEPRRQEGLLDRKTAVEARCPRCSRSSRDALRSLACPFCGFAGSVADFTFPFDDSSFPLESDGRSGGCAR